jgi:hypothetical protein
MNGTKAAIITFILICTATASYANDNIAKRISKPIAWSLYNFEAPADINTGEYMNPHDNASVSLQELQTGVMFPIYRGESFRIISGVNAAWHYFRFSGASLHNISTFDLSIPFNTTVPINDKWTVMAIIAPGVHSDLKKVNYKDFKSSFLLLANYTYSEKLQISLGVAYSRIFGEDKLFPAAGLTWSPDDSWTIRLVFPKPAIIYSFNSRLRFLLGAEPAGGEWNIKDPRTIDNNGEEYTFEFKGWRIGAGAEYDITNRLTLVADAGSTFKRTCVIDDDEETILDSDIDDTLGFRFGLQLHR